MKKNFLMMAAVVIILLLSIGVRAQDSDQSKADPRIYTRYDAETLNKMMAADPNSIDYCNFIVRSGYFIMDYSMDEKAESYRTANIPQLQKINNISKEIIPYTITDKDLENFNIYLYNFSIGKERTIYQLGNTGKILVVLSQMEITEKYNASRGF
jgi:hypothetical protein